MKCIAHTAKTLVMFMVLGISLPTHAFVGVSSSSCMTTTRIGLHRPFWEAPRPTATALAQQQQHPSPQQAASRTRNKPMLSWKLGRRKTWKMLLLAGGILAALSVLPLAARASSSALAATSSVPPMDPSLLLTPTVSSTTSNTIMTSIAPPVSTSVELQLTARLVYAALLGAGLGKERSFAKHSAGVRTMALVAMGAASYTVCSAYGFVGTAAKYDPSRMAANVASGVGFVGAGVITTTTTTRSRLHSSASPKNIVHGLTTAATIWLSAAVGVACGVGLAKLATAVAATTIGILRLGRASPIRSSSSTHQQEDDDDDDDDHAEVHDTSIWDEHHPEMTTTTKDRPKRLEKVVERPKVVVARQQDDDDDEEDAWEELDDDDEDDEIDVSTLDENDPMARIVERAWRTPANETTATTTTLGDSSAWREQEEDQARVRRRFRDDQYRP